MIEALVALAVLLFVGALVLVVGGVLFGLLFGLAAGLLGALVKVAPVLLVGWVVLRWLERRGDRSPSPVARLEPRSRASREIVREEDEVWLDT